MAAVASNFAPTVTVKVYKNGNRNFFGKTIVINRRHIRSMDALYDVVTEHIASFNAVRKICTPIGGRPVQSLESIRNKSVYVAAGREGFKKLNYADLGVSKPRPPRKTNIAPKKTVIVSEGRHKMDYEWEKRELKIIHVFCNGDVFKPSVKIVLQKRLQQSMEQILNIVREHVFVAATVAALYTIDGKLVLAPAQLVSGEKYVAVERGRWFKRANYGGANLSLSRSPRAPFLPQIGNGQMTNKGGLPRKHITKRKPRAAKTNIEDKSSENLPRDQTRDQSRVTTESVQSPRDVESNFSPDPPVVNSLLRVSQGSFTISASPPAQLENDTPVQEYEAVVEENDKDDSSEVGNVFKASGLLQEEAEEVKDSRKTKEEKPLDLLPAEEVLEEVLEQVEDAQKTSGDRDEAQNRQEAAKEVEDDVGTKEDDPKLNETADKVDKSQVQAWENDEAESVAAVDSSKAVELSHHSPEEERAEPASTSSKIDDNNNSADAAAPSEQSKKDDESGRVSASPEKEASTSRAGKEEDKDSPASSEDEKSEDDDDSEDDEEDEDDEEKEEAKKESENQANESNNADGNSAPEKGSSETQNADKTSYIS